MNKNLEIISIEGNIGSGKSTMVNFLKNYLSNKKIYFLEEPVEEWEKIIDTSDGKNIIEKFYMDQDRYSFSFQMMAYISRLLMLKKAIQYCNDNNINLIICERSLQTDKNVFCKMLYDNKKIEEINYTIYLKWFDEFIKDFPPIYYIYLKTNPEIAYQRVIKRNRKGETISLDYLKMCHNYHEKWLNNLKICYIINNDDIFINQFNQINYIIKKFDL
tara:strand:- start:518 stop:1168 length:651 start_codon:yes stop_codon:yes gene_type:complete